MRGEWIKIQQSADLVSMFDMAKMQNINKAKRRFSLSSHAANLLNDNYNFFLQVSLSTYSMDINTVQKQ